MLLNENNVQEILVKPAQTKAVFIYFFVNAPECEKATLAVKQAIPADNDYVSLVEADVSTPVGQAVAAQLGLQSVPTLVVLQNSTPVDGAQGSEIETKVFEMVRKYLPTESDNLMREALTQEASGNLADALALANKAYGIEPNRLDIKFIYARLCIKTKNLEKAHELLDNPGREEQGSQEYKDLISSLTLAEEAADSPEIRDLQKAYEENPQDTETIKKLAVALSNGGRNEEALNLLFEILKKDLSNIEIKQTFLDILSTLSGNPLQKTFRRKLYTLMY